MFFRTGKMLARDGLNIPTYMDLDRQREGGDVGKYTGNITHSKIKI